MGKKGSAVLLGFVALTLAACGPPSPPPSSAPAAPSVAPLAPPSPAPAASASATASAAVPSSPPPPAAPPAAPPDTGSVTPKVTLKKVFTGAQEQEGWPEYEYAGFPAVAEDASKVAVVEERDGWGHTKTPGVRVLDATGKTLAWLPLVPAGGAPVNEANATKAEPTFKSYVNKANAELAKTKWLALSAPTPSLKALTGSYLVTMQVGAVALRMSFASQAEYEGRAAPKAISIRNASTSSLVEVDPSTWPPRPACATPSFKVVGMTEKLVVLHQHLGATTHACDGVPVSHDWRVVKL